MNKSRAAHRVAVLGALTVFAVSAGAHHGPSTEPLYDTSEVMEFEGEVTAVFWRNPHARFRFRVTAGPQTGEIWEVETNPPGPLSRVGFPSDLLPIGSEIKVAGIVSRRKANYMSLYNLLLPNGYEFSDMARPNPLRFSDQKLPFDFSSMGGAEDASIEEPEGIFKVWLRSRAGQREINESDLTEAAKAAKSNFDEWRYRENPDCIPPGMPTGMMPPTPVQFVDERATIRLLQSEYDLVRTIHMNPFSDVDPETVPLTPLGYSVGRWEDDTLVVTTTRINWPVADYLGAPQSTDVVLVERFTPAADGRTMAFEMISTDPAYLIGSVVTTGTYSYLPGWEMETYDCRAWDDDAQ